MTQAIEILERHRLFLTEVEREADVQDAIKAVVITVKQQAEEIERLRALVKRHEDALDEANMADGSVVDNDRLHIDFPCECTYWCHVVDLDGVHTSHHENCPKRNPLEEAKVIISNLVRGIRLWASEEDGVYDEVWHDYLHALLFLQRNADFIAALKADKINNPEGYAAIEAAMKEEK